MRLQVYSSKEHVSNVLTGERLSQLSDQCMRDTELVYTKSKAHDHKTMLLVAMPACSAATVGKHLASGSRGTLPAKVSQVPACSADSCHAVAGQLKLTHTARNLSSANKCISGDVLECWVQKRQPVWRLAGTGGC